VPYTPDDIRTLIAQGESQRVEFKTKLRDGTILGRLISAFANAEGGIVFVGVGDRGEIVGTDVEQVARAFHLALANIVNQPKVDLEATAVDGKQVATITIGQSERLTVAGSGAFRRTGTRTEAMGTEQIVGNLQQHGTPPEDARSLADAISGLTQRILELQEKVERANSVKGQLPNLFVSGLIGAVLGVLLTALLL
jgi:predicted HTH transcriptional regulator